MDVLERIGQIGIVPVIAIDDAEKAVPLAQALIAGGLPVAEVTFRTSAAEEAIRRIAAACPDMLVGAGTVLTCEQADRAAAAGAKFIVAPGLNPEVAAHVRELGLPMVPGVATATEIEQAMSCGFQLVKFFPAEQCGGTAMLKALAAPYRSIRFMPTGGVNANNVKDYLALDCVAACGGSWMVKSNLINEGRFDEITALTRGAVDAMLGFSLGHIGINCPDAAEADTAATWLTDTFGFDRQDGAGSSFVGGRAFEVMKEHGPGTMGHIAILTNSVTRAVAHLQMRGVQFDMDTARYDAAGKMNFIYISGEYAGFRYHLSQR